eukprot:1143912-Pelagomonas_calceolata.AAC.3
MTRGLQNDGCTLDASTYCFLGQNNAGTHHQPFFVLAAQLPPRHSKLVSALQVGVPVAEQAPGCPWNM